MAKNIKKYKVGIDSETYAVSIVESPAIESDFVALKEQKQEQVMLEMDERHMLYGAALIPDKDIYRNNGEQEFYINFTKESIEKMSQDFMKNYRQNEVTLDHSDMASDITIVESWLVEDPYKDKSNALGISVPQGTWMIGMKVNQIDAWERVKAGELKGFSVESMISLEEFSKNDNNMNIDETNEMGFWNKMKSVLTEVFASLSMAEKAEDPIEPVNEIDLVSQSGFTSVEDYRNEVEAIKEELEGETPAAEPVVEEPKAEEPVVEEPVAEEPVEEAPKAEEPKSDTAHLEELINNLRAEIDALKDMNGSLQDKVKEMGKQPSAQPVNTNASPSNGNTYSAWREQMRQLVG